MKVSDVMTRKLFLISEDLKFFDIVKFLVRHKISGAPVVDKNKNLVGLISEKDLLYKLFPSQKQFYKDIEYYFNHERLLEDAKKVLKMTARDIMRKEVIFISPDDNVLTACSLLLIHNIRRLVVVEKGKLVGIVTTNNLYKNFLLSINKRN